TERVARAVRRREILLRPLRHRRGDPGGDAFDRAAKPDDEPEVAHPPAVPLADRRAAAGVDDGPRRRLPELRKHDGLETAKALDAVLLDGVLVRLSGALLDVLVDLEHARGEAAREDRRERALADAGRAD